jgi:Sulfatase
MTRRLLRSTVAALGAATICSLWIVAPLVLPSHDTIYHWGGPASSIFIPAMLDFVCMWLVFSCLLLTALGEKRGAATIWTGVALFLPWAALKSSALLVNWDLPHWVSRSLFGLCTVLLIFFYVFFQSIPPATLERLRRITSGVLCIVAVYGMFILVQLGWFGWQARGLNSSLPLRRATQIFKKNQADSPRIIWIVLDELSYQQVYEHRFHTLKLPAFDELAKQSTIFTHVVPAGIMTTVVIPSLMTGMPVDQIQPSSNGVGLRIHNAMTNRWLVFDQHDTIFSDALNAGYHTAVTGWFIPYCRILPDVLDQCFWTFGQPALNKMLPRASIVSNVFNPLLLNSAIMDNLPSVINHGNKVEDVIPKTHISDYRQLSNSADQLLQEAAFDFILIHMAVPHPGGIYNRATRTLTTHNSTYIDNLALADSYLAHVRSLLESAGQWDSSAVVIMGDHSWRTKLIWSSAPDWTSEEQEASNGAKFDDRPAYIVKLPEQRNGNKINVPFAAVDTRALFSAIMKRQIVSSEDLSLWVDAQPQTLSKGAF